MTYDPDILALTGRTDLTEDDLNDRTRRRLDTVRREREEAAALTAKWAGKHASGTRRSFVWPHEESQWEGVVKRVLVGNPYNRPHAQLDDGRIVPLPEGEPPQ